MKYSFIYCIMMFSLPVMCMQKNGIRLVVDWQKQLNDFQVDWSLSDPLSGKKFKNLKNEWINKGFSYGLVIALEPCLNDPCLLHLQPYDAREFWKYYYGSTKNRYIKKWLQQNVLDYCFMLIDQEGNAFCMVQEELKENKTYGIVAMHNNDIHFSGQAFLKLFSRYKYNLDLDTSVMVLPLGFPYKCGNIVNMPLHNKSKKMHTNRAVLYDYIHNKEYFLNKESIDENKHTKICKDGRSAIIYNNPKRKFCVDADKCLYAICADMVVSASLDGSEKSVWQNIFTQPREIPLQDSETVEYGGGPSWIEEAFFDMEGKVIAALLGPEGDIKMWDAYTGNMLLSLKSV